MKYCVNKRDTYFFGKITCKCNCKLAKSVKFVMITCDRYDKYSKSIEML